MSEWWTYSLSSFLLFSPRTYYRLFELYNVAIWPLQIVAFGLGLTILLVWLRGGAWAGRVAAAILAACWLWVAWAYLFVRYDTINWAARYFAVGFVVEALLLIWAGLVRDRFRLSTADAIGKAGIALFVFALVVQPLIGPLTGRPWVQAELFGIAPDPTVVATIGILVAARRLLWMPLIIPLLWCAISSATLWTMESPDALVMPTAGVLAVVLMARKSASRSPLRLG